MTTGEAIALPMWTFVQKSNVSAFLRAVYVCHRFSSKEQVSFNFMSPSAVILEPKKIKSVTVSIVSPSICYEVMGLDPMIFVFWMLSFKPDFSLSSFTLIAFCHKGGVICISEVIDISFHILDSSLCFIQPGIWHDVLCI